MQWTRKIKALTIGGFAALAICQGCLQAGKTEPVEAKAPVACQAEKLPSQAVEEVLLNDYSNHKYYVNSSGKMVDSKVVPGRCSSPYIRINRNKDQKIKHIQSLESLSHPIIIFYDIDGKFTHAVKPKKKNTHYSDVVIDKSVFKDGDVYYRFNSYSAYDNSVSNAKQSDVVLHADMERSRRLLNRVNEKQAPDTGRQILNPPLPKLNKATDVLDVLVIGSSWSVDQAGLIRDVALSSGIHLNVGSAFDPGIPYSKLNRYWADNTPMRTYRFWDSTGKRAEVFSKKKTLKEILKERKWDVIVIGNSARHSPRWAGYQPHMRKWIRTLKMNATNPNMVLATYMGWTPSPNGKYLKGYGYSSVKAMMQDQINTMKKVVYESGIDLMIPTGSALYSLRTTSVNNHEFLTADTLHLDGGVARYTAALSFFGVILTPIFGESILDNPYRSPNQKGRKNYVPVTDENAPIVQKCVLSAISDRFNLIDMSKEK